MARMPRTGSLAGIVGVATAYQLRAAGHRVCVVERYAQDVTLPGLAALFDRLVGTR